MCPMELDDGVSCRILPSRTGTLPAPPGRAGTALRYRSGGSSSSASPYSTEARSDSSSGVKPSSSGQPVPSSCEALRMRSRSASSKPSCLAAARLVDRRSASSTLSSVSMPPRRGSAADRRGLGRGRPLLARREVRLVVRLLAALHEAPSPGLPAGLPGRQRDPTAMTITLRDRASPPARDRPARPLTTLLVVAAPVLAHDGGEGLYGETNDKVVTNAGFILIAFFPIFIFADVAHPVAAGEAQVPPDGSQEGRRRRARRLVALRRRGRAGRARPTI